MKQKMEIWFDDRKTISGGFFYYTIMVLTIISFLAPIFVLFLRDFNIVVPKAGADLSIILMFIGVFWLTSFLFPIAYNDINGLSNNASKAKR